MTRFFLIGMAIVSLFSCDKAPVELTNQKADEARLASMFAEIETLISDKSCTKDGKCAVIAYGDKACGGPVGYLIYSSGNVNENQLQDLVEEFTELQSLMNDQYGYISDCSIASPPDVSCLDGNCE